jgi:hypothetical protein
MAERLADFADVHSGFEKFNRERMPELMGAASFKPRSLRGFQREEQMSKIHERIRGGDYEPSTSIGSQEFVTSVSSRSCRPFTQRA